MKYWALTLISLAILSKVSAQQCGTQAGGALCPNGLCCSQFGWCGSDNSYCKDGCQSQCRGGPTPSNPTPTTPNGGGGVGAIITPSLFGEMLKYRDDPRCHGNGFYTYNAFINAANSFNGFGTTGDMDTRKKELAAFFGQTSHETTGGWDGAPDGRFAWGYCFVREGTQDAYCDPKYCFVREGTLEAYCDPKYPCPPGKRYFGRGPIQLTHNYNYVRAGEGIKQDLINNPDLVATDAIISFKTAIWYWMTPQDNKPSSHYVITGRWTPSDADRSAGRVPGYGVITNIINGGVECGKGPNDKAADRIGFYKRYCDILKVGYGNNLDCNNQKPFNA